MDVEANRSAEKLKRRKRADTEHAANSRRLKRHCSNQHLNSGTEAHVPLVHSDDRVYQQDTSPSELSLSPENGQQHPGQDNVASGSTRAHAVDGSVKVGNVQGLGSVVQKSPAHSDHLPISTRRSLYCERFLGFGPATRSDGHQGQGKFPSPPEEDLEDPSGEDPEGLELGRSKPELESVPGRQGRPLLSPEQEKESPAPVPAPARPQTRLQEESSLNLGPIPATPVPNFSNTCDSSILHHQRLADLCCGTAQDPQHDDSGDDDEVPIVTFGNIDSENDPEHHHEPCENTVLDQPTKPLRFEVTRGHSVDDTPEDINSDDGGTNGELGERSEPVIDLYDTDTESIEGSQNDATNSHHLSQRLDSMTIGESGSEGYASDAYANRGSPSPSPSPEQNVCSSPTDTDALYQDSSSEAASLYEDSDYETYDDDQSDEQTDDEEDEYLSDLCEADKDTPDANDSNALTPMAPSGRRRLTSEERELVRQTREIGACVRCRFQKIKCFPDPRNPEGKCKTCRRFSKTSPKTIHRIPCLRLRITEIVLYRSGGLNLTRRWKGTEMRDIPGRLTMSTVVRIQVSQNFYKKPIFLDVVQFTPQDGDVTARYWTEYHSGMTVFKKKELATYCLSNIYETAENIRQHTVENALPELLETTQDEFASGREGRFVICKTYQLAMIRFIKLTKEMRLGNPMSQEDKKEVKIFGNLFIMWFAIQHTIGSLYIQGDETLGMEPETQDKSYPLCNKIPAPRMVVAQFDPLVCSCILDIYKDKLLRDVDWLFNQDKNRWWFAMYTVVFILLREASRMTADRYRHARENFGPKPRYSIPGFVESLHESCNNILTHWHYYNCNKWPKNKEDDAEHFAELSADQLDLIRQTCGDECIKKHLSVWKQFKANNGKVNAPDLDKNPKAVRYTGNQDKFDWDHPLYWVAQMFEKNWYPHPTYQREPEPNHPFPTPISTPS